LGAGVDSASEQEKLEATLREMLENGDESHTSTARFVWVHSINERLDA